MGQTLQRGNAVFSPRSRKNRDEAITVVSRYAEEGIGYGDSLEYKCDHGRERIGGRIRQAA